MAMGAKFAKADVLSGRREKAGAPRLSFGLGSKKKTLEN
jgi:hypothetical protein